jgi:hypothetical protein
MLAAATLPALLTTAGGCASQPAPRAGTPSAPVMTAASGAITSDATTMRQRWALFGAQQVLVQWCMQARDLTYLITSPGPEPSTAATTSDTLGHGSPPGYGVTTAPSGANSSGTAEDRYVRALTAAQAASYSVALDGRTDQVAPLTLPSGASGSYETSGCTATARTRLYGNVRDAFEDTLVPQDVNQMFALDLQHSQRYQAALDMWQRCMAASGWPTTSPDAVIASLQSLATRQTPAASLARTQQAEAAADGRCDARSKLRALRADTRTAFLRTQSPRTLALLAHLLRVHQQAVRRARTVLRTGVLARSR